MTEKADQRITLRFGADDLNWIAEQAADEGVDHATMVRMIINRLRRGRAPLISMMEAPRQGSRVVVHTPLGPREAVEVDMYAPLGDSTADDLMQQRLAELEQTGDSGQVINFPPEAESAALPLRRVASNTLYNPRPK